MKKMINKKLFLFFPLFIFFSSCYTLFTYSYTSLNKYYDGYAYSSKSYYVDEIENEKFSVIIYGPTSDWRLSFAKEAEKYLSKQNNIDYVIYSDLAFYDDVEYEVNEYNLYEAIIRSILEDAKYLVEVHIVSEYKTFVNFGGAISEMKGALFLYDLNTFSNILTVSGTSSAHDNPEVQEPESLAPALAALAEALFGEMLSYF